MAFGSAGRKELMCVVGVCEELVEYASSRAVTGDLPEGTMENDFKCFYFHFAVLVYPALCQLQAQFLETIARYVGKYIFKACQPAIAGR